MESSGIPAEEVLAEGSGPVMPAEAAVGAATDADPSEVISVGEALDVEAELEASAEVEPLDELGDADMIEAVEDDDGETMLAAGDGETTAVGEPDESGELDDSMSADGAENADGGDAIEGADGIEDGEALEVVEDDDGEAAVMPITAASMDAVQLKQLIEALVFASDKPLTVQRLRQLTRVSDVPRLEQALAEISTDYQDRGLILHQVSGGYQFRTRPQFSAWVQQLIAGRPVRLSRAQLETLAIIAYRQPITRPEIDDIRGVDSSATLKLLMDRALIRVLGKKEEVGRPMLYGTTKEFLDFFSLGDLRELPTLREYSELSDESRKVMSTRLGIGLEGGGSGEGGEGGGSSGGGDGGDGGGNVGGGGSDPNGFGGLRGGMGEGGDMGDAGEIGANASTLSLAAEDMLNSEMAIDDVELSPEPDASSAETRVVMPIRLDDESGADDSDRSVTEASDDAMEASEAADVSDSAESVEARDGDGDGDGAGDEAIEARDGADHEAIEAGDSAADIESAEARDGADDGESIDVRGADGVDARDGAEDQAVEASDDIESVEARDVADEVESVEARDGADSIEVVEASESSTDEDETILLASHQHDDDDDETNVLVMRDGAVESIALASGSGANAADDDDVEDAETRDLHPVTETMTLADAPDLERSETSVVDPLITADILAYAETVERDPSSAPGESSE